MKRSTLDKLLSSAGAVVAVVLFAASVALLYAHNFVHNEVKSQLAAQKIDFPAAGSAQIKALSSTDRAAIEPYAGQQLTTGKQAKAFADHYINAHIGNIGGGLTYSQLSAKSLANPTDQKLAGQVQTVFRGETLRGMLLNAYAFDTMATVAYYGAIICLTGGAVLTALVFLGFRHADLAARPAKTKKRR